MTISIKTIIITEIITITIVERLDHDVDRSGARTDRSRLPRHGQGIRSDQTSRPRRWVTRAQNPPYCEHHESHAGVTKIRTGRDQYKDLWPPSKEGGSAAARGRAGLLFQRHLSHLLPSPAHQSAGHLAASCLLMGMQEGWQQWQPLDTLSWGCPLQMKLFFARIFFSETTHVTLRNNGELPYACSQNITVNNHCVIMNKTLWTNQLKHICIYIYNQDFLKIFHLEKELLITIVHSTASRNG